MNAPAIIPDDETEAHLLAIMEEIRDLDGHDRRDALIDWARSEWWHPAQMLYLDWPGKLAREAWRALKQELEADTPSRRWNNAPHAHGRPSIARLCGMEGSPFATYACAPFRTYIDDDERSWIAGAVGAMPMLDSKRMMRWNHLDITDVILWDPRTGEGRLAGEHHSTSNLILPYIQDERMTVYGDTGAYFRAWAGRRARTAELGQRKARGEWNHPVCEPDDGGLPGALILGEVGKVQWRGVTAATVIASTGVTKDELRGAALRAAHLPKFTEGGDARG